MPQVVRLKRRASGAAGAPAGLASSEPAYNMVDKVLYIGHGDDGGGNATSVEPIGGSGAFVALSGDQTVAGVKTFSSAPKSSAAASAADDLLRKGEADAALALKAPLASPALTGAPTAPTAANGTNTTQIATTAFVQAALGAAGTGDVVGPASSVDGDIAIFSGTTGKLLSSTSALAISKITGLQAALDAKAPLASPTFTGTPAAPTATAGTNTTQVATTAFVQTGLSGKSDTSHSHSNATTGAAGFMSAADKSKLDGVATNANNYSHPSGDGNLHVPATSTTNNGKFLKAGATAGAISWEQPVKGDVGLGNVDNTSDANKPVSTAQQAALDLKAPLASPTLTGVPAAPTAAGGTNTTQIATTAFVQSGLSGKANTSHTHAIADTTGLQTALDAKAPLASPTFTGTPAAPTAAGGTNTTQIATTAFVQAAIAALIDASPGTLDTLNELAAALGDDPNFAATVTSALAGKLAAASNLSDLANAATARINLGLGSMATQAASAVSITGGTIGSGVTIQATIDGGTF